VDLEVKAGVPSLVVIAQTWYHPWRAYIDGAPAPLLRANYAFQALEVPAGTRQVRVVYQDSALRAGSIISGVGLLVCLGLCLLTRPRARQAADQPGNAPRTTVETGKG
jgi:uncharacterized membrane protein YfhO